MECRECNNDLKPIEIINNPFKESYDLVSIICECIKCNNRETKEFNREYLEEYYEI